ncbi:MAG: hypothetical protein IJU61_00210 [Victivallales bacterium]|nr:hypothetical protein [Victivallales bacterium]
MSNIVTIPVNRKMTADSPHAVHYGDPGELTATKHYDCSRSDSMKYWLFHGAIDVGAHGKSIADAKKNLIKAIPKHIKRCREILKELKEIDEIVIDENAQPYNKDNES